MYRVCRDILLLITWIGTCHFTLSRSDAIAEDSSGAIERRNSLLRRQYNTFCSSECYQMDQIFQCYSADCICPIISSVDPAAFVACINCLAVNTTLGGNLTWIKPMCANCKKQCTGVIDQTFISSDSCPDFYCTCQTLDALSSTDITTCANCVEKVDSGNATALYNVAQQCGITSASVSNICSRVNVGLFGRLFWISVTLGVLGSRCLRG